MHNDAELQLDELPQLETKRLLLRKMTIEDAS